MFSYGSYALFTSVQPGQSYTDPTLIVEWHCYTWPLGTLTARPDEEIKVSLSEEERRFY
jgi:hypothetical protein